MEPTLSTLAEIAANLLKLERRVGSTLSDTAAQDAKAWEELMPFGPAPHLLGQPVLAHAPISPRPRVTVLRLLGGGLV